MTQEQRDKLNAYHRQYYQLNLEKQRQRSIEKYHRLKEKWKANLTPEKKAERDRKNYESQVRFVEKTTGRKVISYAERRKKKAEIEKEKEKSQVKSKKRTLNPRGRKTKNVIPKEKKSEIVIPIEKQKRWKLSIVLDVLREYKNHYLSLKDIPKWTELDWKEFNKIKQNEK